MEDNKKAGEGYYNYSRLIWYAKQLLPFTYWTTYTSETGEHRFTIWRMWFGRVFDHTDVKVVG